MQRLAISIGGYVLVLGSALLFWFSPISELLDHKILDQQFQLLRGNTTSSPAKEIVIVGIDDQTISTFREPIALWHPHLAALMNALAVGKPDLIALDLVLPDKSYEFLLPDYDRKLLKGLLAIKQSKTPLIIAQTVDNNGALRSTFAPIISLAGPDALGLVLLKTDRDGKLRRASTTLSTEQGDFVTFFGRITTALQMPPTKGIINFTVGPSYDYIPMQEVIEWLRDSRTDQLRNTFADKIVIVGPILSLEDRHPVPVPLAAWEPNSTRVPGVLIHAQAVRSSLSGGLIQTVSPLLVLVLCLVGSLLWWLAYKPTMALMALLIISATSFGVSLWFLSKGTFIAMSGFCFSTSIAVLGRLTLEATLAFRERRRLRYSFDRYVSPNVMTAILAGQIQPDSRGQRCNVCVLFSDIRSFTTRSETEEPEAIIKLLNDYFEEMTEAIHSHGGTIDKFIGDGLMAFFGAPNKRENPSQDAFNAARDMLQRLVRLNQSLLEDGIPAIEIGVGLHTGDVVVGHVGSAQRHEFTIIGDTVNTAARLESLTKQLGYPVVCSTVVAAALKDEEGLVDLGERAVKGRAAVAVLGWQPNGEILVKENET